MTPREFTAAAACLTFAIAMFGCGHRGMSDRNDDSPATPAECDGYVAFLERCLGEGEGSKTHSAHIDAVRASVRPPPSATETKLTELRARCRTSRAHLAKACR
jgi:hypothetical protein